MSANELPHAAGSALKQRALDRWENEGGEISCVPTAWRREMSAGAGPRKKLIMFDLDGTLAESKAALDAEMAALLGTLLRQVMVSNTPHTAWR